MPGNTQFPLLLQKDTALVLAVYNEAANSLTELTGEGSGVYKGDYRECSVVFHPIHRNQVAHVSTTTLTLSEIVERQPSTTTSAADGDVFFSMRTLFSVALPHVVVEMAFSPKGTYLATYAMMDAKRTPEGNLSVFEVSTGQLIRRGMQARWPAMKWSAEEAYVVRPVQGRLHVMDGSLANAEAAPSPHSPTLEEGQASDAWPLAKKMDKLDLMLAQDKEIEFQICPVDGQPILALFKPFYKQRQATFTLYRLPHICDDVLYEVSFGRAESATISWSHSGNYIALLVKSERDPSGKSYYGTVQLHLIDVGARSITDVRLRGEGGNNIHDCQWSPTRDELLVIHGKMPRNSCTLVNQHGAALVTFGEAPRNMAKWAPNGELFVLGGSGNLAGDYQFYHHPPVTTAKAASTAATASCTGEINEKCSFQEWAPDSYHFLCSTVYTRLRMDNKIVVTKANGSRLLTQKYPMLYGAHWVTMQPPSASPRRPVSPRPTAEEKPKSQAYCPPGGPSRAAALLRRDTTGTAPVAKPAGPVGATVVVQKKKRR